MPAETDLDTLRHDVATANRIAHRTGLVTAFGHISGRIPGSNRFLFPTRASPALARPDRLLVLDTDGNKLEGEGNPNTEFWIHARIYAARADVMSVAHVHAPACITLGQIGQTVRPVHNSGAIFDDGVPVFPKIGLIRSRELGDEVAAALGQHRAMLLRGHGANVTDANVRYAVVGACQLEEGAELQVRMLAAAGGNPDTLRYYTQSEGALVRSQLDNAGVMNRAWEYYEALVEGRV